MTGYRRNFSQITNKLLTRGEKPMSLADIVKRGGDAVGVGDFDTSLKYYVEDMIFIMPGQSKILDGRRAVR
jgi:ketosteroid isomerase-like protein